MSFYNTGLVVLHNQSDGSYFGIDGENTGYTVWQPAHTDGPFTYSGPDPIIPWCDNLSQIKAKAFRFFRDGVGQFYLFSSNSGRSGPWWTSFSNPSFEGKQAAGDRASYVDVYVDNSGRPRTVRVG